MKNTKCEEKVPWIGGKPRDICNLDDAEQRQKFGIELNENLKKGDYLVHKHDDKWSLVERKDGDSNIRYAIQQIKDTLGQLKSQLKKQGKTISQIIVVFEKLSRTESKIYSWNSSDHKLTHRLSPNRSLIMIDGLSLEMYYTSEVDKMRIQKRL